MSRLRSSCEQMRSLPSHNPSQGFAPVFLRALFVWQMVSDGVDPDVMSYRQALGACLRGARGDGRAAAEAVGLVEDMGRKGLAPDIGVFEALVRCVTVSVMRIFSLFRVCVCMYICVCVFLCMPRCRCIMCLCVLCVCLHVCVSFHVSMCLNVCVCVYVYMCVCMCLCLCLQIL